MATFEIVRYGAFNQKSTMSFSDEAKALEEYGYDSRNASRGRIEKVELVKDGAVIRFTVEGGEDTEVVVEKIEEVQAVTESVEVAVEAPKVEVKKEEKKVMVVEKPALKGSEKQVAWAETLRDSYIAIVSKTHAQSVAKTVAEHADARYWIDNRYGLGVTNAQQREIQKLWKK